MTRNPKIVLEIERKCNQIVDELKTIREEKELTTYRLAELTGIRQPNITRMETLETIPNLKTIVTVCEALGVELVLQPKTEIDPEFEN